MPNGRGLKKAKSDSLVSSSQMCGYSSNKRMFSIFFLISLNGPSGFLLFNVAIFFSFGERQGKLSRRDAEVY